MGKGNRPGRFRGGERTVLAPDKIPDAVTEFFRSGYPEMQSVEQNIETAEEAGYELLNASPITKETWVKDCYDILEPRRNCSLVTPMRRQGLRCRVSKEIMETLKIAEDSYGYVFYVLQRSNCDRMNLGRLCKGIGLRTADSRSELAKANSWIQNSRHPPDFDQRFYIGFNICGYRLHNQIHPRPQAWAVLSFTGESPILMRR